MSSNLSELLAESSDGQQGNFFPVRPADSRRFERFYFRTLATATIHPAAGSTDKPQICYVLTKDLSRGGISILHPVPLFESQRIDLALQDGRKFSLAIRCVRQTEDGCFVMGCRFVSIEA